MGGKPCIRGMRVTVGMIVGQIGAGHSIEDILADYPYLEKEDVLSVALGLELEPERSTSRGQAGEPDKCWYQTGP